MGCLKLTYNPKPELRVIHSKKELTLESSSKNLRRDELYLYNGKELQEDTEWYDYGWRQYDPALGRWHVKDALAEKYTGINPYHYCYNNPIRYIDLFGLEGVSGEQDIYGRDRFNENGMYIAPMDRQGGMGASGYGDPRSGHWESEYETKSGYNYLKEDEGNTESYHFWSYNVYRGQKWIWDTPEERMYGNDGGSQIIPLTAAATSFLIVNGGENIGSALIVQAKTIKDAADRLEIPTEVIDDILQSTNNFRNMSKAIGKRFIWAGGAISIIDGVVAMNNGNKEEMTRAGADIIVGGVTGACGLPGFMVYGAYLMVMDAPLHPTPAYMTHPFSSYNNSVRRDNTNISSPNF